jgi:hypothetical protein
MVGAIVDFHTANPDKRRPCRRLLPALHALPAEATTTPDYARESSPLEKGELCHEKTASAFPVSVSYAFIHLDVHCWQDLQLPSYKYLAFSLTGTFSSFYSSVVMKSQV